MAGTRTLKITLTTDEYKQFEELAEAEVRTVWQHATFLLKQWIAEKQEPGDQDQAISD